MNEPVSELFTVWLPLMTGLTNVLQQTPRAVIESPPSLVTFPPEVADWKVMAVTVLVVTVGLGKVVKSNSLP